MSNPEKPFSFRVTEEDLVAFEAAAAEVGLKPREWARLVCRVAAGNALPKQLKRVEQLKQFSSKKPVRDGEW